MTGSSSGCVAPAYAMMLPLFQQVGLAHGYAIAIHGSMASDLDMVAMPWTEEPSSHAELFDALYNRFCKGAPEIEAGPTYLLHHRVAYKLPLRGFCFVDLTIILREGE